MREATPTPTLPLSPFWLRCLFDLCASLLFLLLLPLRLPSAAARLPKRCLLLRQHMGQGICYACTRHLQLLLLLLLLLIYLYRFFSASDSKLDLCFPPPTCPLMSATHCATTTTITATATRVWFVRQLPFSPTLSLFLFPPAPPLCWTLHGCQLMYNTAEEFLLSCFMYCAQFAICCYFFLLKQLRQIALLWTKKKKKQKQRRSKRWRRLRCQRCQHCMHCQHCHCHVQSPLR